jgi:hypothetical protein
MYNKLKEGFIMLCGLLLFLFIFLSFYGYAYKVCKWLNIGFYDEFIHGLIFISILLISLFLLIYAKIGYEYCKMFDTTNAKLPLPVWFNIPVDISIIHYVLDKDFNMYNYLRNNVDNSINNNIIIDDYLGIIQHLINYGKDRAKKDRMLKYYYDWNIDS